MWSSDLVFKGVSRTASYDEEPGRASLPWTCRARRRQSAVVGGFAAPDLVLDVAIPADGAADGAGESAGGLASWGAQAPRTPATPPASSALRATGAATRPG